MAGFCLKDEASKAKMIMAEWNHNSFRNIILRRDKICWACESKDRLQARHIIPVSKGGTSTPVNGLALCPGCHADEHPDMPRELFFAVPSGSSAEGWMASEAADLLDCHPRTIVRHAKNLGIEKIGQCWAFDEDDLTSLRDVIGIGVAPSEAAKLLDCSSATVVKHARNLGLEKTGYHWAFSKEDLATLKTGIPPLALAVAGNVEMAKAIRGEQGFTGKAIANDAEGWFYIVQIVPELDSLRVKLGFAGDVNARLQAHRTVAPTARLVEAWPCKRVWEPAAIDSITRMGCKLIANEVFQCDDLAALSERASEFFEIMPAETE